MVCSTPTWEAWRNGSYTERKGVFALLWKAFVEWRDALAKDAFPSRKYLPAFWIEGRPGDGKSVLLLELLAACLREQVAPSIAWLEHSSDGWAFSAPAPAPGGWVFCAEVPTRVEGEVRERWVAGLRKAGATALVTSGSPEARHGFELRFGFCAKVTTFALPPFSLSEAVHFADWYGQRTGVSRDAGALWWDGMSLTGFLFALHHGRPLAELTSDVRGALGNLGLGGRVRAVWLANALGLWAPASLLGTEAARNHAARIAEHGVVPVETGSVGLRLAPPGIAWPLVGTWLGEGHQLQHLTEALAFVLKAWLEAGDEENAVRFLRQLWATEWLMDERSLGDGNRFTQLKRKDVLRELYRMHRRDFGGQPAPVTIPVWLELNEASALMLLPDPVVCGTDIFTRPENEPRRTPLLAVAIWLAADSRRAPVGANARAAVADYFLSPASGPGAGRALMRLVRDTKKLTEARPVAEAWLKLLPDHSEALDMLGALVKRAGNSEAFLGWAWERFARPDEHRPGAPILLASLLEARPHNETMRRQALAWARSHGLEPETGILWLTLLLEKLATEEVLRGALRWLAANPSHSESEALRERLLVHYPEARGAAWVMSEWLRSHSGEEQTPGLLPSLLEAQPNNRKASALALEWVSRSLTHPSSPKLLRLLARHPEPAVQAVAESWFEANPDSPSHAELLTVFIHALHGTAAWIARGEAYVASPQRPGREHVVGCLLAVNGCQLHHVRLVLQLLAELPVSPRTFLETALGCSLARHPLQAAKVFREFAGEPQIPNLARALARGLAQMGDACPTFAERLLPMLDEEAAFLTWYHVVRADVRSPEIIWEVQEWLQTHYRKRGYTLLLGALRHRPAVWKHLVASGRLDRRIVMDYRNFRSSAGLP